MENNLIEKKDEFYVNNQVFLQKEFREKEISF